MTLLAYLWCIRQPIKSGWAFLVTIRQLKAARALLGWRQRDLAERAGLAELTIMRIEQHGLGRSYAATAERVVQALENAGVVFTAKGGVDLK